jgi:hypothetical protein
MPLSLGDSFDSLECLFEPEGELRVSFMDLLRLTSARTEFVLRATLEAILRNPQKISLEIDDLLVRDAWRDHLVAATAAALGHLEEKSSKLWECFDRGTWVSPQVAAALSAVDPNFVPHAAVRAGVAVRKGAALLATGEEEQRLEYIDLCKDVSSLYAFLRSVPSKGNFLGEEIEAGCALMAADDYDNGGEIATSWLASLSDYGILLGLEIGGAR